MYINSKTPAVMLGFIIMLYAKRFFVKPFIIVFYVGFFSYF